MSMYIDTPFSKSGSKTIVPKTTTDGSVNYTDGFGSDYSLELGAGNAQAKAIERASINQLFYDLSSSIKQLQENGFFPWQSTKEGGYDKGAAVSYNGVNFVNTVSGNTKAPNVSGWNKIDTSEFLNLTNTIHTFDIFKDNSAIALYQLDENALDTGGAHNGKWSGTAAYNVGKIGQAANFNGKNYISLLNNGTTQNFSVSLFFSSSNVQSARCIIDLSLNNAEIRLEQQNKGAVAGRTDLYFVDHAIHNFFSPTPNTWFHVVITYDGSNLKLYKDGKIVTAYVRTGNLTTDNIVIGTGFNAASNRYFEGLIDQVRIFNKALTIDEVNILYKEV